MGKRMREADSFSGFMVGGRNEMKRIAKAYLEDDQAIRRCQLERFAARIRDESRIAFSHLSWNALMWSAYGMQSVSSPHTFASALMATDCSDEVAAAAAMPWPAFEVVVPSGIVASMDVGGAESMYVCQEETEQGTTGAYQVSFVFERGFTVAYFDSLADLAMLPVFSGHGSQTERAIAMLRRFLLGVVLEVITTPAGPCMPGKSAHRSVRRDGFRLTSYVIGKPLDIDCRQDVRDYIAGTRRTEPRTTTLVRGHWRSQPHGPGNMLRKLLWIMPFYRGHGPMLVRPIRLGVRHDDAADEEVTRG